MGTSLQQTQQEDKRYDLDKNINKKGNVMYQEIKVPLMELTILIQEQ